jgi:diacylglycerol kinase family enzyme
MKVHIIANPAAGGGKGALRAKALHEELARRAGVNSTLTFTKCAGDATSIAASSDAECLVSVGGDGTANEVLNGMNLERSRLSILRAGTANVAARALKLPTDPAGVAALIASGASRRMDIGQVNERRFLLGIGAGLDGAVVRRVAEQQSRLRGIWRWFGPAIHVGLNFNHAPIRARVDGEVVTETSSYAIVGNCIYSAGIFPTTRRACVDDGFLDLCAMHKLTIPKLISIAFAIWSPRFPDRRDVVYRKGLSITLEAASDLPVPLQVDGDMAGFLPARCTVLPKALEVVAPA